MDCSKIENYLRALSRICKHEGCEDCPIAELGNGGCIDIQAKFTAKCIAIVQEWSDEHPLKTYKQDFLEKFPKAKKSYDGTPNVCIEELYGEGVGIKDCEFKFDGCIECWNRSMLDNKEE